MKKMLFPLVMMCFALSLNAQFLKLGIKAGASTTNINAPELNILDINGVQNLKMALKNAQYGIHGGLVIRMRFGKNFMIMPEILLNSNKVDYSIIEINNSVVTDSILSEKYQYLDIPFMFGYKSGPIRLHAGPVGHFYLNSTSELLDNIEGYEQKFEELTLGWQAGLGLDLWKFTVDFRYEGNFSKFGDHIVFFGNKYSFDQSPSRFLLSVGFVFGEHYP
ncbi:MAG: PorT family protein [Saprospiraceae bacterium]|nr:PorT family protein [Saprospiraceae bacterium]MCB9323381.1 PorT family protein [Lewinellaceae bacterium]